MAGQELLRSIDLARGPECCLGKSTAEIDWSLSYDIQQDYVQRGQIVFFYVYIGAVFLGKRVSPRQG
ncbi:hypothetical protein DSUL_260028 [Desulfovibrionales bacterium]